MPNQLPWLETPIIYDVRAKPRNIASLTGTKDLQMVGTLSFFFSSSSTIPPVLLFVSFILLGDMCKIRVNWRGGRGKSNTQY